MSGATKRDLLVSYRDALRYLNYNKKAELDFAKAATMIGLLGKLVPGIGQIELYAHDLCNWQIRLRSKREQTRG